VDKGLSFISTRYKRRRELKNRVRIEEFELLIVNPNVLLLQSVKTILLFISFFFMILFTLLLGYFYITIPPSGVVRIFVNLVIVAGVVFLFMLEFKAFTSLRDILGAYDVHREISKKTMAANHNKNRYSLVYELMARLTTACTRRPFTKPLMHVEKLSTAIQSTN
jgi:hypothetical protein